MAWLPRLAVPGGGINPSSGDLHSDVNGGAMKLLLPLGMVMMSAPPRSVATAMLLPMVKLLAATAREVHQSVSGALAALSKEDPESIGRYVGVILERAADVADDVLWIGSTSSLLQAVDSGCVYACCCSLPGRLQWGVHAGTALTAMPSTNVPIVCWRLWLRAAWRLRWLARC